MHNVSPLNRDKANTYQLLAAGDFVKIEQFGPWVIERPSLNAVWPRQGDSLRVTHRFERQKDHGSWVSQESKKPFVITLDGVKLEIRFTDFGHLGLFAEHRSVAQRALLGLKSQAKVLNLFAYTGYMSLVLAKNGASVDHVDSSKASVEWAKVNAGLNGIDTIRWITEDVRTYVKRQIKRGVQYDMIVLDPPSFGRGEKSQVWKIENDLYPLLKDLSMLRTSDFKNIFLSCHTEGYGPFALSKLLAASSFHPQHSGEMFLEGDDIAEGETVRLPAGAFAC